MHSPSNLSLSASSSSTCKPNSSGAAVGLGVLEGVLGALDDVLGVAGVAGVTWPSKDVRSKQVNELIEYVRLDAINGVDGEAGATKDVEGPLTVPSWTHTGEEKCDQEERQNRNSILRTKKLAAWARRPPVHAAPILLVGVINCIWYF